MLVQNVCQDYVIPEYFFLDTSVQSKSKQLQDSGFEYNAHRCICWRLRGALNVSSHGMKCGWLLTVS